jgi:hypothetical protein
MSYELAWKAGSLEANVAAKPNGQITEGFLRIESPRRKFESGENCGWKGLQHNHQARSVSNRWFLDSQADASSEDFGLLIATGRGSSNVEDGRIDF